MSSGYVQTVSDLKPENLGLLGKNGCLDIYPFCVNGRSLEPCF